MLIYILTRHEPPDIKGGWVWVLSGFHFFGRPMEIADLGLGKRYANCYLLDKTRGIRPPIQLWFVSELHGFIYLFVLNFKFALSTIGILLFLLGYYKIIYCFICYVFVVVVVNEAHRSHNITSMCIILRHQFHAFSPLFR